jgi:hypothetical protein
MGHTRTAKIDRIACPWLITRFIDEDAEFLYVAPDQRSYRSRSRPVLFPMTCQTSSSAMMASSVRSTPS